LLVFPRFGSSRYTSQVEAYMTGDALRQALCARHGFRSSESFRVHCGKNWWRADGD